MSYRYNNIFRKFVSDNDLKKYIDKQFEYSKLDAYSNIYNKIETRLKQTGNIGMGILIISILVLSIFPALLLTDVQKQFDYLDISWLTDKDAKIKAYMLGLTAYTVLAGTWIAFVIHVLNGLLKIQYFINGLNHISTHIENGTLTNTQESITCYKLLLYIEATEGTKIDYSDPEQIRKYLEGV